MPPRKLQKPDDMRPVRMKHGETRRLHRSNEEGRISAKYAFFIPRHSFADAAFRLVSLEEDAFRLVLLLFERAHCD